MKTKAFRFNPAIVVLYVLLFTLATGAFRSHACQLTAERAANKSRQEAVTPAVKQVQMPAVNPLRALSSRFI